MTIVDSHVYSSGALDRSAGNASVLEHLAWL